MQGANLYLNPAQIRGPGHLSGVLFQNIEIAVSSVLGEPDLLWGAPKAQIMDVTFDNVSIGGEAIKSLDQFKHNAHVKAAKFK